MYSLLCTIYVQYMHSVPCTVYNITILYIYYTVYILSFIEPEVVFRCDYFYHRDITTAMIFTVYVGHIHYETYIVGPAAPHIQGY